MSDLDERLRVLDRLDPPDLWGDIRVRDPRPGVEPGASRSRLMVVVLAVVLATVGVALSAKAFFGGTETRIPLGPKANGKIAFLRGQVSPGNSDAQIYVANADGSRVRQISHELHVFPGMSWSPDGTRIAFVQGAGEAGPTNIFELRRNGTGLRAVTHSRGIDQNVDPAWSPDGTRIAFSAARGEPGPPGTRVIYRMGTHAISVMDADGGGVRRLTSCDTVACQNGLSDSWPTWSPDGRRIAFVRNFDLYVVDVGTGKVRPVLLCPDQQPGLCSIEEPSWSPDGTRILFVRLLGGGDRLQLDTVSPDGHGLTALYRCSSCDVIGPGWSPDGIRVVFSSSSPDRRADAVYTMNADGSDLTRIADGCCPAWQALPVAATPRPTAPPTPLPSPSPNPIASPSGSPPGGVAPASIAFWDSEHGIAAGPVYETTDGGRTTDGGSSWTDAGVTRPDDVEATSAWFLDDRTGFVLLLNYDTRAVDLVETADGGTNWRALASWPIPS